MTATPNVYDFPREWHKFIITQKFDLRSVNQSAPLPWSGAGQAISGPHTQMWLSTITFAPISDVMDTTLGPVLQDMDAFFARLRGRAGVLRMFNAARTKPWYDRNLTAGTSNWSDGSTFTDGSGFSSGFLPPEVYVTTAAAKGARYLTLGGLPASLPSALRRGDLLQVKPNGIPGSVPHLYKPMFGGDTNSSGQIGVAIEPPLRTGISAGDIVGLRYASTLFRLTDDTQFEIEMSGDGNVGNIGGSLVEAMDLVP